LNDTAIEYPLFPVAYEYVQVLLGQIKEYDASDKKLTLKEYLVKHNLAAGEPLKLTGDSPKSKGYNFYQKDGRSKDY